MSGSPPRVVVTGMGVLSCQGIGRDAVWQGLKEGVCGLRKMTLTDPASFRFSMTGEVPGYVPTDFFDEKTLSILDRFAQFGTIAAREAVTQSGIEWTPALRRRTAIVTGSCVGGQTTEDEGFTDLYKLNKPRVQPMMIPKVMANAGASQISLECGITGPVFTIATACSSANHAMSQAYALIRSGQADVALCGGSEAPLSHGILKAWEAMRVMSPDVCRPFSKDRRGIVLSEGGAMLVIEREDHARARGAQILGEIAGTGLSSDAHHLTQPSVEGPAQAIQAALDEAGIGPERVGYINAHGTGTLMNDPTEAAAIRRVFGDSTDQVWVSSTKSMHGHALGAAGAIEAVATLMAMQHGVLPPTINLTDPDEACALRHIREHAEPAEVEYALSNSFAFGGLNAVILFRRAA